MSRSGHINCCMLGWLIVDDSIYPTTKTPVSHRDRAAWAAGTWGDIGMVHHSSSLGEHGPILSAGERDGPPSPSEQDVHISGGVERRRDVPRLAGLRSRLFCRILHNTPTHSGLTRSSLAHSPGDQSVRCRRAVSPLVQMALVREQRKGIKRTATRLT
jgi:hypothetical protein